MTISNVTKEENVTLGNLIGSMPTTQANTGWRAYEGFAKHGQRVLVMHSEGTPANSPKTKVYHPISASQYFSWEIQQSEEGLYREFYSIAKWIEHNK